jgi:hypothetical protein
MLGKIYQGSLVAAAIYILACDFWAAVSERPAAADLQLGAAAISNGIAFP